MHYWTIFISIAQTRASISINPFKPTVAIYGYTAIKHFVPDRVKPSFVIFDIRAL